MIKPMNRAGNIAISFQESILRMKVVLTGLEGENGLENVFNRD
jgi:hypothetical protein